ncbi:hypothetical protein ACPCG0_14140 [Propionibacteriaceae bacterium Y1923]
MAHALPDCIGIGYCNGSSHYNGTATTRLNEIEWIDETVHITASVVDAEGETVTRLCAAFGQFPYLEDSSRTTPTRS